MVAKQTLSKSPLEIKRVSRGRALLDKVMPKNVIPKNLGVRFSLATRDAVPVAAKEAPHARLSRGSVSSAGSAASRVQQRSVVSRAMRRDDRQTPSHVSQQSLQRQYVKNLCKRAQAQLDYVNKTCVQRNGVMSRRDAFRHAAMLRGGSSSFGRVGGLTVKRSGTARPTRIQTVHRR